MPFPSNCPLGKSFKYDAPSIFDLTLWSQTTNRAVTLLSDVVAVTDGKYAPSHITANPLTFFTGDSYGATQKSAPFAFDSVTLDVSSYFDKVGGGSSDNASALFEIEFGLKVAVSFTGSASYQITISRYNNTMIYTAAPESIGSGTFTYSTTRNIRIEQTADGIYDVFVDDVQVVTALDASVDQGGAALGPKRVFLTSIFGTYDVSPNPRTIWWHRFSNIYLIGPGYEEIVDDATVYDMALWTNTPTLEIGATDDTMIVSGSPAAYRTTKSISDYTNYVFYQSAMVSTKKTFSEFRATADLFQTVYSAGGGGGSAEPVVLRIENGPVVRLWQNFGDSQFLVSVHHYNAGPTSMYFNSNFGGLGTKEVRVLQDDGNAGIFSVYVDNILIVNNFDVLSPGFGPRTIHMESVFRAALYGPELIYGHQSSGQWRDFHIVTNARFSSTCLGPDPTRAAILPSSVGRISHARILKGHKGVNEATAFHKSMQGAT